MTILVGGGGGVGPTGATGAPGPGIAGLTSDGANGIVVADAITAGNASAESVPDRHEIIGSLEVHDTPGNAVDGDETFFVIQDHNLVMDQWWSVASIYRRGLANAHTVHLAVFQVVTTMVGDTGPLQSWQNQGGEVAVLGNAGGLGLFGHAAPAAPRTLAQSVITAITDANAKAAVQACANALSDMGVLTLT